MTTCVIWQGCAVRAVLILETLWLVFKMLLPAHPFLQPWCSIAARLSFLSQSASSAHLPPWHPGTDAAGWQGTGAQECDLRTAVPGQKQRLLALLECLAFWWGFGFFVWIFCVLGFFWFLFFVSLFCWFLFVVLILVFCCCWGFSLGFFVCFCDGFFKKILFESSALGKGKLTEGKFCVLYLGLTGFVYLQSLVK